LDPVIPGPSQRVRPEDSCREEPGIHDHDP
jgi:hypothetical protein